MNLERKLKKEIAQIEKEVLAEIEYEREFLKSLGIYEDKKEEDDETKKTTLKLN